MKLDLVVSRAAGGKIAEVGKKMDRQSVAENADVLEPLIQHFGTRPGIGVVMDVVARFLYLSRPRGKALPKSVNIKTEAWILRRLITIFAQVARRPHIPRDPQMRRLFAAIGINVEPVPEGP
ncbi:unnamed protein product [Cladocopium goreaui]|uniref:Uncharacterized protein n=1 Tax=Cladocopium goreaui TaxID=2562237 RepID=A0A9P1BUD5_9DINO|nr:unnamed protein product [Cladocopium goreaui]